MSATYNYPGTINEPNLDGITLGVAMSSMEDKSIQYCIWDKEETDGRPAENLSVTFVCVVFENELSPADKAILDSIVDANR